ncbi:uncharacterized protein TNCV_3045531 [Trichonephila clavipes]|nr:uncharacterized protein TNCV_3045531 [Trichonephila clavipes]
MKVTRVEQRAYLKIAVLRERNVMECCSELVEALGNNALPYRTVARWVGKFQLSGKVQCVEKLEHRPYSPDISPYDFYLITKIKEPIRGRWFVCNTTREDIANAESQHVTRFRHDAAIADANGIQCISHRWQRVVTVAGDYIESF